MCFLFAYTIIIYISYAFWFSIPLPLMKLFFLRCSFSVFAWLESKIMTQKEWSWQHLENMQKFYLLCRIFVGGKTGFLQGSYWNINICRKWNGFKDNQRQKCSNTCIKKLLPCRRVSFFFFSFFIHDVLLPHVLISVFWVSTSMQVVYEHSTVKYLTVSVSSL